MPKGCREEVGEVEAGKKTKTDEIYQKSKPMALQDGSSLESQEETGQSFSTSVFSFKAD